MSVDLAWADFAPLLVDDLRARLNARLEDMELPSYLGPTHIETLDLGTEAPDVQVVHVGDVWREFRDATAPSRASSVACTPPRSVSLPPRMPMRLRTFRQYDDEMPTSVLSDAESFISDMDDSIYRGSDTDSDMGTLAHDDPAPVDSDVPSVQVHLSVQWLTSTLRLSVHTSLQMHHADSNVMSLPITLVITGLELFAQVILALDGTAPCLHVSLSEPSPAPSAPDGLRASHDPRMRSRHQGERILPYVAVESQIGEPSKHVLENVGKVERFVGHMLRQLLESELVYPRFYTICL
ncbi:Mitochondrial distribution and morphology protein 12 [Malassezia equina]|uniref:Mitochondrial distribution and morphology protein 12 n=1 Tax=Malassezia equina TaxID=1381935 RepID=A0AAF0EHX8_9BASI|nr:Mitochondrial distribution and morphology protein 12 [Malassezia equina]